MPRRTPPTPGPSPSLPAPRASDGSATQLPVWLLLSVQVPPTPQWSPRPTPVPSVWLLPRARGMDAPLGGRSPLAAPAETGMDLKGPLPAWAPCGEPHGTSTMPQPPIWAWVTAVGTPAGLTRARVAGNRRPGVWGDGGWGVSPQHGLRTGPDGRQTPGEPAASCCPVLATSGLRLAGRHSWALGEGTLPASTHRGKGRAAGRWLRLGGVRGPCIHQPGFSVAWRVGPAGAAWGAHGPVRGGGWGQSGGAGSLLAWLRPRGRPRPAPLHTGMPGPGPSGGGQGWRVRVCGEGLWGRKGAPLRGARPPNRPLCAARAGSSPNPAPCMVETRGRSPLSRAGPAARAVSEVREPGWIHRAWETGQTGVGAPASQECGELRGWVEPLAPALMTPAPSWASAPSTSRGRQ